VFAKWPVVATLFAIEAVLASKLRDLGCSGRDPILVAIPDMVGRGELGLMPTTRDGVSARFPESKEGPRSVRS
jgi:hypothetical protein